MTKSKYFTYTRTKGLRPPAWFLGAAQNLIRTTIEKAGGCIVGDPVETGSVPEDGYDDLERVTLMQKFI